MRLSMWVLAKELKKFQITAELHEPSLTVERARIAKPDSPHSNQDESTAWITMDDSCGCVLVTCRADKIKVDCSSVNEVSELLQGTFEKYSTWYESMISCAMDGTLEEIVSPSAEILGVRLTAVNMNTLSIVCSAEPDDYSGVGVLASAMQNDHLSLPVLSDIERSADCVFASCNYRLYHVGAEPFALLPLQSEYGYYLLIAEGRKCTPGILQLCTYLTQVIHVWGRLHPAEETDSMLRQMISGQAFLPEKA